MLFGKKNVNAGFSGKQNKRSSVSMAEKSHRNAKSRHKESGHERDADRLEEWLDFEDEMEDMGL